MCAWSLMVAHRARARPCVQDHVILRKIGLKSGGEVHIALVMDGHGMLGEVAARAAGVCIAEYIETQLTKKLNPGTLRDVPARKLKEMVNTGFQKAHEEVIGLYGRAPREYRFPAPALLEETRSNTSFRLETLEGGANVYVHPKMGPRLVEFGTTASLVIFGGDLAVVGHVGDSDVIVGSLDGDGFVTATSMTTPHSAFSTHERFRIAELLSVDEEEDGHVNVNLREDGYLEVSNLGGLPTSVALGMTRAIGHKHLEEFGVISRPDVRLYDTGPDDVVLVLATDGVWDAMHPRDAALFVLTRVLTEGDSAEAAVKDLCDSCVGMQERELGAADNTSAVLLCLKRPEQRKTKTNTKRTDVDVPGGMMMKHVDTTVTKATQRGSVCSSSAEYMI